MAQPIVVRFQVNCPSCNRTVDSSFAFDGQGNPLAENATQNFRCYCDHLWRMTPAELPQDLQSWIAAEVGAQVAERRRLASQRSVIDKQIIQSVVGDARFADGLQAAKLEIAHGNKAGAIRLVRETSGVGIEEAKAIVAAFEESP